MSINALISHSADYKRLKSILNTPLNKKKGRLCTLSHTTIDSRNVIIRLLEKDLQRSFIYSTIDSINCQKYIQSIQVHNIASFGILKNILNNSNFTRESKVTNYGEFSVKGDIISFWPSIYTNPIRAHFFGDSPEKIEMYDAAYQNTLGKLKEIVIGDESVLEDDIERDSIQITSIDHNLSKNILLFNNTVVKDKYIFDFNFTYPPLYFKRIDIFEKEIVHKLKNGWKIIISTKHKEDIPQNLKTYLSDRSFSSGFESQKLKLAVYTDREIFGTIYISSEKTRRSKKINKYLAQLEGEIEIDDYIVHEDYGIATYKGLVQKEVLDQKIDYLLLEYAQKDTLSVPITQVQKLTKYIGADATPPKITRLGKTSWNTIKQKVKAKVEILARELVKHYALVEIAKAEQLYKNELEEKLASEFEFTETDDQLRVISEILHDLEKPRPMNRLLVGDVGFGKTEVALRAAFRAVMNGKQVAILCPTTILVSQHYSVFKHRLNNYPLNIKTLSRFGTKRENERIVKQISQGRVDIVIGTHRLLSNDLQFKDLGLLIIDEEQKFGVAQKEKMKKFAYSSHVLSMSATPIPRTLSMALSSLRDISIITTPPPGRKAIDTKVLHFNWSKAAQAIQKEIERGGQVYFLHNEVRTIESVHQKLQALLPDVRFTVGHGQMHPQTLEKIMREFYDKTFDCLICTTIIENGIDIKNVNTIIINKAEKFGLAQLYQLRGRVGRSKRQAYAYIFYTNEKVFKNIEDFIEKPKYIKKRMPFEKVRERLEAIIESQELGAGFKIASRDLEIRGAGNLLGRQQHGNISSIGLGLYTQLLGEAVERLKDSKGSPDGYLNFLR